MWLDTGYTSVRLRLWTEYNILTALVEHLTDRTAAPQLSDRLDYIVPYCCCLEESGSYVKMRAVSLFSGAGGLDLGFERAGFCIVYANEQDSNSAETWKINRPDNVDAMHVGDLQTFYQDISALKNIDIVIGGPPCQGFSVAGKMRMDDPRNKMIDVFVSVVLAIKPTVFLMENVKALAKNNKWSFIKNKVISEFTSAGYEVSMNVLNAADYGVPERRERMILVGVRGVKDVHNILYAMESYRHKAPTLRQTLSKVGKFTSTSNPSTCTAKVTLAKKPVLRNSAYSGMLVNGSGRPLKLDAYSPTLTASMGGNRTPIIDQRALENADKANWFESLFDEIQRIGRMPRWDVPDFIRRLTICEASEIQTFPRQYKFVGPVTSQYRQIGNAVPCRFAMAIAEAIKVSVFS